MLVKPCGGNIIFGKADKVSLDDLLMVVRKYTKTQSESNKPVGPGRNQNLIVGVCFNEMKDPWYLGYSKLGSVLGAIPCQILHVILLIQFY
jgi:hypothetical protein